jgi:hypothetical protein
MKKLYFLFSFLIAYASYGQEAVITGYVDSPCPNQLGRTVEIYVDGTIDFTGWNLVRQANGGGFTTNIDISALGLLTDEFAYITNDAATVSSEFGITTNVLVSGSITDNGDDAFQLVDGSSNVIDRFGEDGVDGTGTAWDHLDTYYYRVNGTPANGGSFSATQFTYGAIDLLDGEGLCNTANALSSFVPFGTYSTTASTTPTISITGAVSNLFYYEGNGPSNEDSFSVSGINLTTDITVTAPANFEVSLTSGSGFGSFVTVTQTSGTADPTDVFVRMVSGLTANNYSGDVTASSTGATGATVSLTGLVSPADPVIFASGSIADLDYVDGNGPSVSDSFIVSALFLTADLVVTAPADFEISLASASGFGSSINITPDGSGTVSDTEIFVRLVSGLSVGTFSGNVELSSTNATTITEAANGEVFPAATCPNVGDIIITEIMQNPSAAGDPAGEYFEVYNTTTSPIDMIGWVISDLGVDSHTITSSLVVPAEGYAVLGNSATTTPSLDYSYGNDMSLSNGDDEIILTCSSTIIDEVYYDGGPNFPDPSGASMELSITAMNSVDNNTGSNWGEATSDIGNGDLGTPGVANDFTLSANSFDKLQFSIYPNPTSVGYVTIKSNNATNFNAKVFDILGKQVLNTTVTNNRLDVNGLKSGVYILKLTQDNATTTKKLVIR